MLLAFVFETSMQTPDINRKSYIIIIVDNDPIATNSHSKRQSTVYTDENREGALTNISFLVQIHVTAPLYILTAAHQKGLIIIHMLRASECFVWKNHLRRRNDYFIHIW